MDKGKLSLWEAVALAVGTMIGAGIFSVLGVGAQICGSNLPIAFLIAGFITFLVAYSYAHLGKVFISNAGPVEFILRAFGDRIFVGVLAFLYWFSFVVSISLFAKAFAYYLFALLHIKASPLALTAVEAGVISLFTALNFFGTKAVGRFEFFIVSAKVLILLLFVGVGIWSINPQWLSPNLSLEGVKNTLFASAVLFLTYTGFGVITNASENLENPQKNLPRAIYISLLLVAFIYVSIAVVTIGNLPLERLLSVKEYALAEAAKPFLGDFGFTLLAIGALISTSSALNASLYGGANVAYVFAKKGELPEIFERRVWFGEPEGLYITVVLAFLFASLFNLEGIASLISFAFLVIYQFVLLSHLKLHKKVGGNPLIPLVGFVLISTVEVILFFYQYGANPSVFYTALGLLPVITLFEWLYKGRTQRVFKPRFHKKPL